MESKPVSMEACNHAGINLSRDNFSVLCAFFAIFIALGVLRSVGWTVIPHVNGAISLYPWLALLGNTLLMILFALVIWMARNSERANYFLGGSAALGVFPSIPKLHFVQDVTHLALMVFIVANWRVLYAWRNIYALSDSRLKIFMGFLLIALGSVISNYLWLGNVWQFKVGLTGIFLLFLFFIVLLQITVHSKPEVFGQLLKGFLDSARITAILGLCVLVLLVVVPYSTGIAGDGQDTVWGLGYFDRLKLLFDGPGVAGCYFVIAMCFAIYTLSMDHRFVSVWQKRGLFFLIQIMPWLVAASGSRVARIALVVSILTGVLCSPVRRIVLIALPSSLLAMMVQLDFQSLPSAARFFLDHVLPGVFMSQDLDGLRLGDRFFEWGERGSLSHQTIISFNEMTFISQMVGMGYGVAGFSEAPYPSPHNQYLDMIIEVGFFGFAAYLTFWVNLWRRVIGCLMGQGRAGLALGWTFSASFISIIGLSIAYEITVKGIVLVFLLLIFSKPDGQDHGSEVI